MGKAITFREQAEKFLSDSANDSRPNTLASYRSILNARVLPLLGQEDLANVDSATAKLLKDHLLEAGLSPATINLAVGLVKKIVGSATDARGNRLFTPKWNDDFIRLPRIKDQKAPVSTSQTLTEAITATNGDVQALVALLGGTGLRIGEALALGLPEGNTWDREAATITVRATIARGQLQPNPKTEAGKRVVDLAPELNNFLKAALPQEGPLFPSSISTYYRRIKDHNIEGFHSLRRFRLTHQQMQNVPQTLVKYAAGHAAEDVTERYAKVGAEIAARKEWAEKAGLGFNLGGL